MDYRDSASRKREQEFLKHIRSGKIRVDFRNGNIIQTDRARLMGNRSYDNSSMLKTNEEKAGLSPQTSSSQDKVNFLGILGIGAVLFFIVPILTTVVAVVSAVIMGIVAVVVFLVKAIWIGALMYGVWVALKLAWRVSKGPAKFIAKHSWTFTKFSARHLWTFTKFSAKHLWIFTKFSARKTKELSILSYNKAKPHVLKMLESKKPVLQIEHKVEERKAA